MKTAIASEIALIVAGLALSVNVAGQTLQSEPVAEPDQRVADDVTDPAPEVTIRNRGKKRIEEYRINGRLYMIKITPQVGPSYYLIDEKGGGQFVRRDGFDRGFVVPSWVIKTW